MPALSEVHAVVAGCLVDGRPFIGGWIRVSLGMSRKNPFHSLHGPADGRGLVTVSGEELLRWSAATIDSALMDYANPEGAWTGELAVAPVGLASAATALKAFEQFSHHFWFPEGYRDDLQAL